MKGRNRFTAVVPPLQGAEICLFRSLGLRASRSTPGCHMTGFQPAARFIPHSV